MGEKGNTVTYALKICQTIRLNNKVPERVWVVRNLVCANLEYLVNYVINMSLMEREGSWVSKAHQWFYLAIMQHALIKCLSLPFKICPIVEMWWYLKVWSKNMNTIRLLKLDHVNTKFIQKHHIWFYDDTQMHSIDSIVYATRCVYTTIQYQRILTSIVSQILITNATRLCTNSNKT